MPKSIAQGRALKHRSTKKLHFEAKNYSSNIWYRFHIKMKVLSVENEEALEKLEISFDSNFQLLSD